jgi:tRNA-2-methylthio-N6-dimethylallyladenosine synthase
MNEYDSNRIKDLVYGIGYTPTDNPDETDCYVINTCNIREKASDKVYHEVGRIKKKFRNKNKPILIVAGCVAQAENEEMLKKEKFIDVVIGPQSYHKINHAIKKIENKKGLRLNETEFEVIEKFDHLDIVKNNQSKVSNYLTIQEGCDKFCSFCVVPYTRGPEYSRDFHQIISEAKQLVENGTKEIILLGQNVNAYLNQNIGHTKRLSDLILALDNLSGLERIRYTTSHPKDMTTDLIQVYSHSKKLMPFLHLPVQSGSNRILKKMNRKHSSEFYLETINRLKDIKKDIMFSSDFIVGYPDEEDEDFNLTLKLINNVKFVNSYSFIFSPRPGTLSGNMQPHKEANQRLLELQNLLNSFQIKHKNQLKGSISEILIENSLSESDKYFGRDQYFNSVIVSSRHDLTGKVVKAEINNYNQQTLFGEYIGDK